MWPKTLKLFANINIFVSKACVYIRYLGRRKLKWKAVKTFLCLKGKLLPIILAPTL